MVSSFRPRCSRGGLVDKRVEVRLPLGHRTHHATLVVFERAIATTMVVRPGSTSTRPRSHALAHAGRVRSPANRPATFVGRSVRGAPLTVGQGAYSGGFAPMVGRGRWRHRRDEPPHREPHRAVSTRAMSAPRFPQGHRWTLPERGRIPDREGCHMRRWHLQGRRVLWRTSRIPPRAALSMPSGALTPGRRSRGRAR